MTISQSCIAWATKCTQIVPSAILTYNYSGPKSHYEQCVREARMSCPRRKTATLKLTSFVPCGCLVTIDSEVTLVTQMKLYSVAVE